MKGNYIGKNLFTRGGIGKFHNFSTFMGICIPRQCTQDDLNNYATEHFKAMAHFASWENVTVEFTMSSADKASMKITLGVILMTTFISFMIFMAIVGFVVQSTTIGNQQESKAAKTLRRQQSQLLSNEQDREMLLRKTPFARLLICFSPIRNLLKLAEPIQIYD